MLDRITVHGARQHNLKNIDVEIPRNTLTVITGLSGSGKSSLAFDTIYAEGQRRYVETLSTYARQFLDQMERPDVDSIDGLSPAISIEQKTTSRSPRSTVGTITEIYDYLRLLYSSIGVPHCPVCGNEISRQTTEQILQHVLALEVRRPHHGAGADRARPQGRVQEGSGETRPPGLRPRAHRRRAAFARRGHPARQAQEPHHRSGGGPAAGKAGDREAPGSVHRDRHQTGQRPGADRGGQRRGAPVLAEAGVHRMRRQHSAAGAAIVLLQQPVRRLRGMSRPGQQVDLRPRQGDCRFRQAAARWRPRPRRGFLADAAAARGTRQEEPHQPHQAVRRADARRRAKP